jgi:hypothetical protein
MSDGTIDERGPCAERGSFHHGEKRLRKEVAPDSGTLGSAGDPGCGVRTFPDWWPERYHTFLRSCTEHLVESIGREELQAIVLTGSFALDEGSVVFSPSGPLFLSDIDLFLVLSSRASHAKAYGRRRELARGCEALFPGAVFSGHVDAGTFIREELSNLPPRPGVFDLKTHGRVLWGDSEVLAEVPAYRENEIGGEEAILLLENRIMSLIGAYRKETNRSAPDDAFRYEIARVYVDIATAALCIDSSYCSGYGMRGRRLRERAAGSLARLVPSSLLPEVERWTAYKLDPSGGTGRLNDEKHEAERLWERAARHLLELWKRGAGELRDRRADGAHVPAAESLFRRRGANNGRYNLRFWKRFLSRLPAAARVRMIASLRGTLARKNPLDVIREDGVRLIEHRVLHGGEGIVPGLRMAAAGNSGEWRAAAKQAHGLWAAMVFGGKDA